MTVCDSRDTSAASGATVGEGTGRAVSAVLPGARATITGRETIPSSNLMRVLLDARKAFDGGIGTYTQNLIVGLTKRSDIALTLLGDPSALARLSLPDGVRIVRDTTKPYSLRELFSLSHAINAQPVDVFHTPHYVLPQGLTIPTVATVHDLIHLHHPERFFYPWIGGALLRSTLNRANAIITVSSAVRQQIEAFAETRAIRLRGAVSVIPNAVLPSFVQAVQRAVPQRPCVGSYFLAVLSQSKPHKNVAALIAGFEHFARPLGDAGPRLVLIGAASQDVSVQRLVAASPLRAQIDCVGRVATPDLIQWYQFAVAVVVPSRAEGFGLPVIEAKVCGTRIVATPVPALRELLEPQDICCDGFSADDLTNGLAAAWQSRERSRVPATPEWRERYSPDRIAAHTVAVYRAAIGVSEPRGHVCV